MVTQDSYESTNPFASTLLVSTERNAYRDSLLPPPRAPGQTTSVDRETWAVATTITPSFSGPIDHPLKVTVSLFT